MKKIRVVLSVLLLTVLLCACIKNPKTPPDITDSGNSTTATPAPTDLPTPTPQPVNLVPDASSTFTGVKSLDETAWTNKIGAPETVISSDGYSGECLKFNKNGQPFNSPAIDISKIIKADNSYTVKFKYKYIGETASSAFTPVVRTDKEYSFSPKQGNDTYYSKFTAASSVAEGEWGAYSFTFTVLPKDLANLGENGCWNFCFLNINSNISEIYIDDFEIFGDISMDATAKAVTKTETWMLNEVVLVSDKKYDDPYRDIDVDLVLSGNGKTYTVPCFWDGKNVWRGRFYCPDEGVYTYTTTCTDTSNKGLHNQTSTVTVSKYSGTLELYKRGFIKAENKYFVYDDGTPFFYLGDTHWGLGNEELDKVQKMVKTRSEQGFTVIQSEPIGATFNLVDGVDLSDIAGFHLFDAKFAAIANAGLVHANAEFFFPSEMETFIKKNGGYTKEPVGKTNDGTVMHGLSDNVKAELKRLSRYWVARYSAYPVMWTLAQEVDNDFYWEKREASHGKWSYVNNPYKLIAEYINSYDAYKHPLTAHQENTEKTIVKNSAFNDVSAHNWFAAQWSMSVRSDVEKEFIKEYYDSAKPVVLYESKYCYLWTKNFGARAQGYIAYLSGMCGYGWGGQDTWNYTSTYDENTSNKPDGLDKIWADEKKMATYDDALSYCSAAQMGYMRRFFESKVGQWNDLIPSTHSGVTFSPHQWAFGVVAATKEKDKAVLYLYNTDSSARLDTEGANRYHPSDTAKKYPYYNSPYPEVANSHIPRNSGIISGIQNGTYTLTWFNPVTNEYSAGGNLTVNGGSVQLPVKPYGGDMVLLIEKS